MSEQKKETQNINGYEMPVEAKNGRKINPNSLKALRPWDKDSAKAAQAKGAAQRAINAENRKKLAESLNEFAKIQVEVLADNNMDAVDVLKTIMYHKVADGDYDGAADIAKAIAEYERPKLARTENLNTELNANDLSDEELKEKMEQLGIDPDIL